MTGILDPVVKKREIGVSADRAFEHFTRGIAQWWPLATHSLGGEKARTVVLEARQGGRIYEIDGHGNERDWGQVSECIPGERIVFSWVLERPDLATEVEVRFEALGPDRSRIELIHRGWDTRPDGAQWRANYDQGWEGIVELFVGSAA